MLRRKITTSGNSAALVLSQDLLGLMGVKVGDDVEIEVQGTSLIVRPIDERRRNEIVMAAGREVIRKRRKLLERLAREDGTVRKRSTS